MENGSFFHIFESKTENMNARSGIKKMAHFFFFCAQVMCGGFFGGDLDGNALDDHKAGSLEGGQFVGVI